MRGFVIVVWQREELVPVDWESCRIDLGERPRMESYAVPTAACWCLDGDDLDAARALAYSVHAGNPSSRVYLLPAETQDPMGEAKARYREEEGI